MSDEYKIEIRAGTDKLKGDIQDASKLISRLYGSGSASAGAGRPSSAASGGFPGSIREYEDSVARQESKAKASKYSSESVTGGIGGGGVNTSGTKSFQINKAVINVAAAKINIVKSKSGLNPSADVSGVGGGIGMSGGGYGGGDGGGGGGGHVGSNRSGLYMHPGESAGDAFGRSYNSGMAFGAPMGNMYMGFHDAHNLVASRISKAHSIYSDWKSRKLEGSHNDKPAHVDHHSAVGASALDRQLSSSAQSQSGIKSKFSAIPVIGEVIGAKVAEYMGKAQALADARTAYSSSQLATAGNVGLQDAGGMGAIGKLGYSAAAKGQFMQQTQQFMTSKDFIARGGRTGSENAFAFSAKFGHSMGLGAGQGMMMSAQLSEMNHGGVGGESQLQKIAGYAKGFEGGPSRRLGKIAQFVTNLAEQQQVEGGGGDSSAIAASLSRLKGHHLGESQHAVQGLSGMMSGGVHSGSPISGLLMLAQAQRGTGNIDDVLKAGDKGITGQGIADLKSQIPPELMKYVMMGSGAKMTQAEHMTQAIYKKSTSIDVDEKTMGGTYTQKDQAESNFWAFEQELVGMTKAAHMAGIALSTLHMADSGKMLIKPAADSWAEGTLGPTTGTAALGMK